jgi:hypothetical protein
MPDRIELIKNSYHIFVCEMCGYQSQKKYKRYPHPAVINLLIDKNPQCICKKCAKRELGSKNQLEWKRING